MKKSKTSRFQTQKENKSFLGLEGYYLKVIKKFLNEMLMLYTQEFLNPINQIWKVFYLNNRGE